MPFSYDVLSEPWIPVEFADGSTRSLGLLEVLERAHEILAIRGPTPLANAGIHRLLLAFLLDALRPDGVDMICELVERGRFDDAALCHYVAQCRSEGVSFDIFSETRPFLQSAFPPEHVDSHLAVHLFPEIPGGNNHTHFRHEYESDHAFTPSQCVMALTQVAPFALMYGRSVSLSINGVPPIYLFYGGRTLFETLALSLVPLSDEDLEGPPVAWRDCNPVPEGVQAVRASILSGLTAQPRRVQLIPEESEGGIVVRRIRYQKGYDYKGLTYFDPYVAYYKDDRGNLRALTPREDRALWRDLGTMVGGDTRCTLLNTLGKTMKALPEAPPVAPLKAIALVTRQKGATRAAIEWSEENLPLRAYLLKDRDKASFFQAMLRLLEESAGCLSSVLRKPLKSLRGEKANKQATGLFASFADEAKLICLSRGHTYIDEHFLVALEACDFTNLEEERRLRDAFAKEVRSCVLGVFNEYANRVQPSARALEWQSAAEQSLRAMLGKVLKGGKTDDAGAGQGDNGRS